MMIRALYLVLLLLVPGSTLAVIETYEFSNPDLELRYRQLSLELRCPKCQNTNIADSNAPISQDLRKLLYHQLEAGSDDEEILDYMTARYGEFVRYRPRYDGVTAVLWLAPVFLLLAGITLAVLTLRSRRKTELEPGPLSTADEEQLRSLLDKTENNS
jgi:cytochrome c-type biogenesis protein CcmH